MIAIWSLVDYMSPDPLAYVTFPTLYILWWLLLAFSLNQWISHYIWGIVFTIDGVCVVPAFLKWATGLFIYLAVFAAIIGWVLKKDATVFNLFLGSWGFMTVYLSSDVLGELFAGLALNIAPVFRRKDVITIEGENLQVLDMNWRFTTLENDKKHKVYVSNRKILHKSIRLYPKLVGIDIQFLLPINIPPHIIIGLATHHLRHLNQGPDPIDVILKECSERGMLYEVVFFSEVENYLLADDIRSQAYTILWYVFRQHNIPFARNDQRIYLAPGTEEQERSDWTVQFSQPKIMAFIDAIPLFACLSAEEKESISQHCQMFEFVPGENLIIQGESEDFLWAIIMGRVSVRTLQPDGSLLEVETLQAPHSVGIMALMTGAPRAATVTATTYVLAYKIDRAILLPIVAKEPQRIMQMAEWVSHMEEENMQKAHAYQLSKEELTKAREAFRTSLVGQIRSFFGLME